VIDLSETVLGVYHSNAIIGLMTVKVGVLNELKESYDLLLAKPFYIIIYANVKKEKKKSFTCQQQLVVPLLATAS
jgi:hypothetical protein